MASSLDFCIIESEGIFRNLLTLFFFCEMVTERDILRHLRLYVSFERVGIAIWSNIDIEADPSKTEDDEHSMSL